jgi:Glycosyltransferase family 87
MAQSNPWNNRLKAVAVGVGLALTALTIRHWYGTFWYGHPPCDDCRADFPGFYAAAKLVWQNPSALYDHAQQLAIQRVIDNRIGESILPFAYPPFTAIVLMPLGWLSFRAAFVAMTLVNALLLVAMLVWLIREFELKPDQSAWLLLSTLCNFGVHSVLLQGQTSMVVLSCLTAFMFAVRGGKQVAAGFWSGCMFFKPQLLAVPFIALAFKRLWKALFVATLVLIALGIVSIVLVGRTGIADYLQLLKFYATTESGSGSYPEHMHNLRALVQYYVPFSYARYFWLALVVPIAALTMWLNTVTDNDAKNAGFLWVGNFLAMMLLTPHLYGHDLVLMIVPAAYILKVCGDPVPWFAPLTLIVVGVLPVLSQAIGPRMPPVVPMILLAGYLACIWFVRKEAKAQSNSLPAFN